jgi:hypothetical protein
MMRTAWLLLGLSITAVDSNQIDQSLTSKPKTVVISTGKADVTSTTARPIQINGYDGTQDTGNWKTMTTNLKSGSNVLISEGLNREDVVKEHQEFLKSDEAKGFDLYGTQYQAPYQASKSRKFNVHYCPTPTTVSCFVFDLLIQYNPLLVDVSLNYFFLAF